MKHFYDSVLQIRSGLTIPAPGVSITVNVQGTQTAATIYSDDGITTKANPLATDANGRFDFYIANGRYDLIFAGTGFANFTQSNVEITDAMDTTSLGKTAIAFTANNTHSGTETFNGVLAANASTTVNGTLNAFGGLNVTGGGSLAGSFTGSPTFSGGILSGTFANLPAATNGTLYGCSDCTTATNPCTGSGTGALAVRQNSAWVCK